MTDIQKEKDEHWHLKKEVTLTTLMALVGSVAGGVIAYTTLSNRVEMLGSQVMNISEARVAVLEVNSRHAVKKIDEVQDQVRTGFKDVNAELKALRAEVRARQ